MRNLPPGPKGLFSGLPPLFAMKKDMLGAFKDLQNQYGDIVNLNYGSINYALAFHPDHVKEILVTHAKSFHRSPQVRKVLGQWNGNNLILSEDEFWQRQRRLIQQSFSSTRFEKYTQMMLPHIERFMQSLNSCTDIEACATDLTLWIVCETMFGQVPDDTGEIARAVKILNNLAVSELQNPFQLPDWFPIESKRQKRWAIEYLDKTIWKFIEKRRNSKEDRGDLLSSLLHAVDDEGDRTGMSEQQVHDECMGLFLAGHDTTASGLIWTFYNLAKFSKYQNAARSEAERVYAGGSPTFSKAKELKETEHVINESLRLFPPAIGAFQRVAIEDVKIGGYDIPKGMLIQPISYISHHDARWFKDPEEFRPERFNEPVNPYAYFPFGAGPRVCIGRSFAMLEMALAVSLTLKRFHVELSEPNKPVELLASFSLRPKEKLYLNFEKLAS